MAQANVGGVREEDRCLYSAGYRQVRLPLFSLQKIMNMRKATFNGTPVSLVLLSRGALDQKVRRERNTAFFLLVLHSKTSVQGGATQIRLVE